MALTGTIKTALSYQSKIGDKVAVYMTGQIKEDGTSSSSKSINDLELYEANKSECRADMSAFEQILYDLEDSAKAEGAEETEETDNEAGTEDTES